MQEEQRERPEEESLRQKVNRLKSRVKTLKKELEKKRREAEEYLNLLKRTRADFENYRKRQEEIEEHFRRFAKEDLLYRLLPIVDNFESALESLGENCNPSPFVQGVEIIYRELLNVLKSEGVKPFESAGHQFDPKIHEAVDVVEVSPEEEGKVIKEIQKGYLLHDKVLRPARVWVGKTKAEVKEELQKDKERFEENEDEIR